MKEFLLWWYAPRNPYSILKMPIALIPTILFILSVIFDFADFIAAFRTEPLFTGIFLFLLPIFLIVFFADAIICGCSRY